MQRKTKRVLVFLLFVITALAFVMSGAAPADCSTSYPGGTSDGSYGGDEEIVDSGKAEDSGGGEYYCRHEKAAWETTQEATCTENGREEYRCYDCGRMLDYRTIKPLGHNYSEWQIVTPATDSEDGLKVRYCNRCKDEETQIIPKTTHTHSFTETVVEPTCTERGYTLHQCTCGEHYEDSFKSALDHSFTNYISDGNATCTQDGTKTAKCDRCDETNTITDVGSKTGHTFDKKVANNDYLKSVATCTAKATYFYSCKCGEKGTSTFEYGNALGHDYLNGVCSRCGEDEPKPTEGLEYALNWDKKSYYCSNASNAKSTDIVIAAEYNGLPVTRIGQGTFYGKSWITSVYIPDSITDYGPSIFYECSKLKTVRLSNNFTCIGYEAFYGCSNLESIKIPNSVTAIGYRAFFGCSKLEKIEIPNNVTTIGEDAFNGDCSGIKTVVIPNSLTDIEQFAFFGCSNLENIYITSIAAWCKINGLSNLMGKGLDSKNLYLKNELITDLVIPDGVTDISNITFSHCHKITSITIPDSVTSIGDYAFFGCSGLETITVNKGNTKYHSKDNCLIETESKTLVLGCKNSIIPTDGSVTSIGDYAFYGCSGLISIAIPDSVTSISDWAFAFCTNLVSFFVPKSITTIGYQSFCNCDKLENIYINDMAAWFKIDGLAYLMRYGARDKKIYLNNEPVTSVIIPKSVTSVSPYAFKNCSSLKNIVVEKENTIYHSENNCIIETMSKKLILCLSNSIIPSDGSVTSIGKNAFVSCYSLENVTIPASITTIDNYAFFFCSGLTTIEFKGTIAQWNAIKKGSNWNYDVPTTCKVKCTDGTISI